MAAPLDANHLSDPVLTHARQDFALLRQNETVEQALAGIRESGLGEKVVYFYVTDDAGRLVGVVPTRRLLTAPLQSRLSELMIGRVVTIPPTATVLEACEFFVLHRFLAFPVVDGERHVLGVVDVNLFAEEALDLAEREQAGAVFETIGFHVARVRGASPWRAFRFRFPWLLATVTSGTACALLASAYEATLAQSLVLAFFLTLVLGLGESVGIQSMAVAIQSLRGARPGWRWYTGQARREIGTALLLGTACGGLVAAIAWAWFREGAVALAIGGGILASLVAACLFGLSVPTALHALRLDPKIAAGPVTLALTDLATLLCYFSIAAAVL